MDAIDAVRRRFQHLRSFSDADGFDAWADGLIAEAQRQRQIEQAESESARASLAAETSRLSSLPWWRRLFASRARQREIGAALERRSTALRGLDEYIDELAEMIDFTPNNRDEQRQLLKQLRHHKKELGQRKKELNAHMKLVRRAYRDASAGAGRYLGGLLYDRSIAAATRRELRVSREAELRPHESEKDAIERQIADVERRILWLERFGLDE